MSVPLHLSRSRQLDIPNKIISRPPRFLFPNSMPPVRKREVDLIDPYTASASTPDSTLLPSPPSPPQHVPQALTSPAPVKLYSECRNSLPSSGRSYRITAETARVLLKRMPRLRSLLVAPPPSSSVATRSGSYTLRRASGRRRRGCSRRSDCFAYAAHISARRWLACKLP